MNIRSTFQERVNLNELSYDCALLVLPPVLGKIYAPVMTTSPLGIPAGKLLLLVSIYFLPVLIGRMYNTDFRNSPEIIKKTIIAILVMVTLFAYVSLLIYTIHADQEFNRKDIFIFVSGTVFLIMGPIAGLAMPAGSDAVEEIPVQVIVFLFTIGVLPLFFLLISGQEIFGDTNAALAFLIILGLMIGDSVFILLLYAVFILIKRLIVYAGIYRAVRFLINLLIPFCVSAILVFFNIHSDRLFIGQEGIHGTGSLILVIFLYIISGVLPFRIIMMFTPPLKPVNVFLGIAATAFMIYVITAR